MSDSKILEDLLDADPNGWATANLIRAHYDAVVCRRGHLRFDELVSELPRSLEEQIGGSWEVWLDDKHPLHKRWEFPLRIKRSDWGSREDEGFVLGFEFTKDNFEGDPWFGFVHSSKSMLEELQPRYPVGAPKDLPSGYTSSRLWLAGKTITNRLPPRFVDCGDLVACSKTLVDHYDRRDAPDGAGWLTRFNRQGNTPPWSVDTRGLES